jgi:hypothetical protein
MNHDVHLRRKRITDVVHVNGLQKEAYPRDVSPKAFLLFSYRIMKVIYCFVARDTDSPLRNLRK